MTSPFFTARRVWTAAALVLILVAHILGVLYLHPKNFFGLSEDDAIYLSSAKALAQGQGYILPSVPGTPPATMYPVLYPWTLSWIWHWNPNFPANLSYVIALNMAFGCAFVIVFGCF